jgi:hypothetical protein
MSDLGATGHISRINDGCQWLLLPSSRDTMLPVPPERANIPADWLAEFEAAARRPLPLRWKYAFIKTYKPVMDDARFRAFDTMEEYRRWCEANLPRWLGYHRV